MRVHCPAMTGLHLSPTSSCGRRCTTPSGVFSLRGARRTVKYDSAPYEVRPEPPVPSADGAREPMSRREEEVDARASSTTSNAEIGHDPHRPEGLRRHGTRLRRCRSSAMEGHRRRRGASNPDPWRSQRTTLGAPAGPLSRKPHWARHLAALAMKLGEKCRLGSKPSLPRCPSFSWCA